MHKILGSTIRKFAKFLAITSLGVSTSAFAADLTWTGSASSDWNNPANWTPQQVPTASDHAIINSGSVTIPADGTFAVMDWTGGTISGSLTVASNGVLNIGGSVYLINSLTNAGTVNWLAGDITIYGWYYNASSGPIVNLAGGVWNIQCDQAINWQYDNSGNGYNDFGPLQYFQNAGTVEKTAGGGTTTIAVPFYNTGTVSALHGTFNLTGGGTVEGAFNAASGTFVNFARGSFDGVSAVVGGAGAVRWIGGSLTLESDVIPNLQMVGGTLALGANFQGGSITNLTLDGPALGGNYLVTGTLNWSGGDVSGSLTVGSNGVLNIGGSVDLINSLTNAGTVNWLAGDITIYGWYYNASSGPIVNLAGGVWNIQCDQAINWQYDNSGNGYNDFGPLQYFQNAGTVEKTAGGGTTTIAVPFYNTGTVSALHGTFNLSGGFIPTGGKLLFGLSSLSDFGKISIAGNATLDGTVGALWLGGYVPAANNSFTVLSYGSHGGIFTNVDLPAAALWATNYSATSFAVSVASINKLEFTTQPVSGKVPNMLLPPVVVQVEHPLGDAVAAGGVPVTLSLKSGGGTLSGTLTRLTDSAGKATFNDLRMDAIGTKTLLASAPVLSPATSAPFKIVPVTELQWTSGGFLIKLNGTNSLGTTIISASTDLTSWTPIYTNPPTFNIIQYLDSSSANIPIRFYRIVEE